MATDLRRSGTPPAAPDKDTGTRRAPRRPRRSRRRRPLAHVALIGLTVTMLYPLFWMLASSFKPTNEIFSESGLLPKTWRPDNYSVGWHGVGTSFTIFFENSLFISTAAIIGNVISCSLAAYAFACLDFRFKRTAFAVMLGTMMLPGHVTLIPQYILFNHLHWVNTFYPLMVPHFFAVDAFFIFLMVQFIRSLPGELYEAARLDGCGPGRIFLHIVLPLLRPALVTTVIFSFIWTYNDFFKQLIYLDNSNLFTVPLGLRLFLDSTGESAWGPMLAMSTLALVPALVLFATFQRLIVDGIATTGLKG
ncbi:MAG: carbohydrate ABC transporter permease [Actinocatenispora sp.]